MSVQASEIAAFLGTILIGPDTEVKKPSSLLNPKANSLVFAKTHTRDIVERLNHCTAILALVTPEFEGRLSVSHIITAKPRLYFARVLECFFAPQNPQGIAPTAVIAPTARIGKDVYIGNFTVIEDNSEVGDGTIICDHVVVRENCIMGRQCLIKSNTVIGEEGFGFEFDEGGTPVRIPHLGRVVIGDHVVIGALNTVVRGTLDDTVIESHVKLDDHVHIAHNVRVGENTLVAAAAEISGSVRIGENVWIGPQAAIMNDIEIGDHVLIGLGTVVRRSVEPKVVVAGNPARVLRERVK